MEAITIAELQQENEKLKSDLKQAEENNNALAEENASLKEEVERLLKTPDSKEADTGVGKTFDFGDSSYKVLCTAITIPGFGKVTANDILANTDLQDWLVSHNSGAIQLIK